MTRIISDRPEMVPPLDHNPLQVARPLPPRPGRIRRFVTNIHSLLQLPQISVLAYLWQVYQGGSAPGQPQEDPVLSRGDSPPGTLLCWISVQGFFSTRPSVPCRRPWCWWPRCKSRRDDSSSSQEPKEEVSSLVNGWARLMFAVLMFALFVSVTV